MEAGISASIQNFGLAAGAGAAGFAREISCGGAVLMGVSLALSERPASLAQPPPTAWLYPACPPDHALFWCPDGR
jgi:hypothetical protein